LIEVMGSALKAGEEGKDLASELRASFFPRARQRKRSDIYVLPMMRMSFERVALNLGSDCRRSFSASPVLERRKEAKEERMKLTAP